MTNLKKINLKFILYIFVGIFIVLTLLFAGAFFFIRANGKTILVDKLSAVFEKPVTLDEVSVAYPLGLKIKNLKVEGYGLVKEADIGLGVWHLLDKNFTLSTVVLVDPQVVIHYTREGKIIFGDLPKEELPVVPTPDSALEGQGSVPAAPVASIVPVAPPAAVIPLKKAAGIAIDKLVIINGAVNFTDHSSQENTFELVIRGVNFRAQKTSFIGDGRRTKFDLTAMIIGQDNRAIGGHIESHGWINLKKKDMKGDFKIVNLDGKIFTPLYSKSVNKRFKNITADLTANLESANNDMIVKGKLTIKDFALNIQDDKEAKKFSPEDLLFGGLQSMAKGFAIDFKFKTKMDHFKMESISFSGNIFG